MLPRAYTPFFKFIGFEFRKGDFVPGNVFRNTKVMRVQFENGIHGLYKVGRCFNQFRDVTNESVTKSVDLVHGQYYRAFLSEGKIVHMQRNKYFKAGS